jgi:isoamylase
LGAVWDGKGVNFALFSEHATKVELCLFDSIRSKRESERIPLPEHTDMVWHGHVPGLRPGQLYGYRVHGPHDPDRGHRFNANKVVLDPYAKMIGRQLRWGDENFGFQIGHHHGDASFDDRDNAHLCPLAVVADTTFNWGNDKAPKTPWHKTVIYELHVKGFTKLHPDVPERLRGTYAGLASKAAIRHLVELGVTAVELMPVHYFLQDRFLVEKGLTNYWGYNTVGFFAPEISYCSRGPRDSVREFKAMVKSLHAAGLEVILDVVYNHTAEGNHMGPTLSLRGIDNSAYYRLVHHHPRYYMDYTGCGNSLNMRHPRVLQLIMDSLRYWVLEMHVDGFRFDLASTLARELHEVDKLGAFFDIVHQDPVLSQVKLIAEPWDLGEGGYQVGNFPVLWTEWNGRYRDCVRRFWRGDGGTVSEFATRLTGSSDLYEQSGRRPYASINFITCHDGFTLSDLVSYNHKHNEANGEDNRDGTNDNLSWNCGAEGPTDDPAILDLRDRQRRSLFATLLVSQGVPMICAGDELSRSQGGNNNAYCQDNDVGWMSWKLNAKQREYLEFCRRAIKIAQTQPALSRRKFFQGRSIRGMDVKDIVWLEPSGHEMTNDDWNAGHVRCLGVLLNGNAIDELDEEGNRIVGDTILILLNAHDHIVTFQLPDHDDGRPWELLLDTRHNYVRPQTFSLGETYSVQARCVVIFRSPHQDE